MGRATLPTLPLTKPLLTGWVWEHLLSIKLAFEHPHSKGLRFLGKEGKILRGVLGVILLLVSNCQSNFRSLTALAGFSLVEASERVSGLSRTAWRRRQSS